METHPETAAPARIDGWFPEIQQAFIEELAKSGCVRHAAVAVGRSRTGAYRLRARTDAHAFRAAWDAALGLAYEALRETAMDRVANGLDQRTYDAEGNLVARKTVHNDRLLMFLLDHHKPRRAQRYDDPLPDDAFARALSALDAAPAGAGIAPPAERNGYRPDLSDDELIEEVRHHRISLIEASDAVPALEDRLLALWEDPIFDPGVRPRQRKASAK